MLPLHPEVVAERVSRFRLEWMSHVFEAGFEQVRHGEPAPPAMIQQGLGSVYAQLWHTIVAGGVPPIPEAGIADVLRAPPKAKPLEVHTTAEAGAGSAARPKAGAEDTMPIAVEKEDWESEVVLEGVGRAAPPAAGSASGSGARP